ncbi:MAG TPA: nucleoside triphosphate pyrophosphohydrolase [Candidatus Paceibacterota bacterium]|nr:nucleoside triphosphate pyrophosphohydrolase [Candidatus Paceibacterota bacterium]
MEKIYYNKLCRDKVPAIIKAKGFDCEVRQVDHDEYKREIIRKVFEEASGVSNHSGREGLLKELADLMITVDAVKKEYGIADSELDSAIEKSIADKGGYDERYYLSWSSDTEYNSTDQGRGFDD